MFSTIISHTHRIWHLAMLALLLALMLCLLTPRTCAAYAFLLRSDPASNAVLKTEPGQVRLWFSEDLNPDGSTGSVVNAANQRMDVNGVLVLPTDTREMDIALRPDLLPGVYVVIWHTQSANDGQIFSGTFSFSIADASGAIPTSNKPLPDQSQFAASSTGQIDSVTIFRWLMAALVDLGVIFWVSGKVWHSFVLDPTGLETTQQRKMAQLSRQRFAQHFSLPALRVLFLANIGVLAGQALTLTEGRWDLLLSPTLLVGLLTSGSFGMFWLIGEVVIALAIMLETILLFSQRHTPDATSNDSSAWLDVLLGLLLLIITTLTSYTTTSGILPTVLTMLVGGLYLLAATLWLGGLFYLALVYQPALCDRPSDERALSLLTILQRFSPLAISAAIIMLLSGTYNAIVHHTSLHQFHAAVYEPILVAQFVGTIALLIAGTWQIFLLQTASDVGTRASGDEGPLRSPDAKLQEQHITYNIKRLTIVLRYTLLLSMIVILCMALTSILVGGF
jgi:copper transport protein